MRTYKKVAVLMAGVLSLALWGCGGSSSSSSSGSSSNKETQEEQVVEQPKEEEKQAESKVAVSIDGAVLGQDYDGKPAVIVTYTFTNVSSEEAVSFATACYSQIYQNGVQCEYAIAPDLEGDEFTNVKAGASTTFQAAYLVTDTSPIEVEVRESFSFDNTPIATATFKFE